MDELPSTSCVDDCDGAALRRALIGGTLWLEKNAHAIDALNVFPVPDGDTGTNMLQTMRSALNEVDRLTSDELDKVAEAAATGALLGARGNSGVILSQIIRGLAAELRGHRILDGATLAAALQSACDAAYKAVFKPVEGTMLTVLREAAASASRTAQTGASVAEVLGAAAAEATESVARTPLLLDVLRDAGVVDAGGQGLSIMLDGMLRSLEGRLDIEKMAGAAQAMGAAEHAANLAWTDRPSYGYCTEFLLRGNGLDIVALRERIAQMGDSMLVVGDAELVRVHVHSFDPGAVLSYAGALGTLSRIKVENMQEQYETFAHSRVAASQTGNVSIVAVAAGSGLSGVLLSLGAELVVPGGQTMNPSVEELLEAVQRATNNTVILLPNNGNIVPAAQQAGAMASKKVIVVATRTVPQGIAALLAYNLESSPEENADLMRDAAQSVHSGEVTQATRAVRLNGVDVQQGQTIALLNDQLVAATAADEDAMMALLEAANARQAELVTLYFGDGTEPETAEAIARAVRRRYSGLQVELVPGGQPHYSYIVSVE